MKQQLRYLFLFVISYSFGQAPIAQFANTAETDYAIVESSTAIDESATGAGLTWNFTNLSQIGSNTDTNAAPTSGETTEYPGTTEVLTITTNTVPAVESKLFIRNVAGEVSITGAAQGGQLGLNFTNNATLGTFPLSYPYTNSDPVAGDFSGTVDMDTVEGIFSGTATTEVDAYGTLNLNDFGLGSYSGSVTRLKTVQDITLEVFVVIFFVEIGTVVQTNYYYFDDADGSLVFRSSTNEVDIEVAAAGIDIMETIQTYEAQDRSTLSLNNVSFNNDDVRLFPNPTINILNVSTAVQDQITAMSIMDLNGRIILDIDAEATVVDVSNLQSGMYLMNIETNSGSVTKRFIKK
ncbi:MAG: T9SS type A sorting domain-containing protein [Psychroserpens sp.]|nr:T9SS type A sorting domain-containing protein [Psychroserpens sp.]